MHSGNWGALRGRLKESWKAWPLLLWFTAHLSFLQTCWHSNRHFPLRVGVRTEHNPGGGCHFGNLHLFLSTCFKLSFGLFVWLYVCLFSFKDGPKTVASFFSPQRLCVCMCASLHVCSTVLTWYSLVCPWESEKSFVWPEWLSLPEAYNESFGKRIPQCFSPAQINTFIPFSLSRKHKACE